jgi:hypothetical protein
MGSLLANGCYSEVAFNSDFITLYLFLPNSKSYLFSSDFMMEIIKWFQDSDNQNFNFPILWLINRPVWQGFPTFPFVCTSKNTK